MSFSDPAEYDRDSLIRALTLVLPPDDAHAALSSHSNDVSTDELASLLPWFEFRLRVHRIRNALARRFRAPPDDDSMQLNQLPVGHALLLALHVGAFIPVGELARILEHSPERVATDLYDARRRLIGTECCPLYQNSLGAYRNNIHRYRDTPHVTTCNQCARWLSDARDLDAIIEQAALSLNLQDVPNQSDNRRLPLWAVGIVGTLLVALGLGFTTSLFASDDPAPLLTETPDGTRASTQEGWLLTGTKDGGMDALNLATGYRRNILEGHTAGVFRDGADFMHSPSGERIAVISPYEVTGEQQSVRAITIVDQQGDTLHRHRWHDSPEIGWPTSWLGEDALLLVWIPEYEGGLSIEEYLKRLEQESRVKRLDLETGELRDVFQGTVVQVNVSPDASLVALLQTRDPREPGSTLELRPVDDDGNIGNVISSVDTSVVNDSPIRWSADSEYVYFESITAFERGATVRDPDPLREQIFEGVIRRTDVSQMDRSGTVTPVTGTADGERARVIAVHPNGTELIYATGSADNRDELHTYWSIHPDDDQPELFAELRDGAQPAEPGILWSSDGSERIVIETQDHYLPANDELFGVPFRVRVIQTYNDQQATEILKVQSGRWLVVPIAWLPEETYESRAAALAQETIQSGVASPPRPVDPLPQGVFLDARGQASPDRSIILLQQHLREGSGGYLWLQDRDIRRGRSLARQASDLSWYDDSHALIGVTELRDSFSSVSRLAIVSSDQRGGSSIDAFFDPLKINSNNARYMVPRVSPTGTRTSFVVAQENNRRVELWIASWDNEPVNVHAWEHSGRYNSEPLFMEWVDDQTLFFTEPGDYTEQRRSGAVALRRLTFAAASEEPEIETLATINPRGSDAGLQIDDLDLSPDQSAIAYSTSHYDSSGDISRRTLHIARTTNLGDQIEIARATRIDGIDWSPDGSWLAASIDSQLKLISADGRTQNTVTPSTRLARYPVWITGNEIWFGHGRHNDVYQITID